MKKYSIVVFFVVLMMLACGLAESEGRIHILSPEDGAAYASAREGRLNLVFSVDQVEEEEVFEYSIVQESDDEEIEMDEIEVDPEDGTGAIAFDLSMFDAGESYVLTVSGGDGEASVRFSVGIPTTSGEAVKETEETEDTEEPVTEDETEPAMMLVSPAEGSFVDLTQASSVPFVWVLEDVARRTIEYNWNVVSESGEEVLSGYGEMATGRKQFERALPVQMFTAGGTYTFTIETEYGSESVSFFAGNKTYDQAYYDSLLQKKAEEEQNQVNAAMANSLGVPASFVEKVITSKDISYAVAAMLKKGEEAAEGSLRIVSPQDQSILAFHPSMIFELKIQAEQDIEDPISVSFSEVDSGASLYTFYYSKAIKAGKTVTIAVPCRYFTGDSDVRLTITGKDVVSETFRLSTTMPKAKQAEKTKTEEPAAEPTAKPTPEPTPQATAEPTPEPTAPAEEKEVTAEKAESADVSSEQKPEEGSVPVKEMKGRVIVSSEVTVNVRAKPDASSEKIGWLKANTVVDCTGIAENGWYRIVLRDGKVGFVSPRVSRLVR